MLYEKNIYTKRGKGQMFPIILNDPLPFIHNFFTVITFMWIWVQREFYHHCTCPLKHFFNLNAMHSVNGHLWTHGRKNFSLGMYKNIESGMTLAPNSPLEMSRIKAMSF